MIHIFTYADKRPDFIRLQYESIKKYLKSEYEYVVFNNAIDSLDRYKEIKNICCDLGVKCVDVKIDYDLAAKLVMGHIADGRYSNANVGTSYPIMYTFRHYLTSEEKICIIDSDMFFIADVDFDFLLERREAIYIPQYRDSCNILYMWNALVLLNLQRNPSLKGLDWNCDYVGGIGLDVGGKTRHYLSENKLDALLMEEFSIYDISNDGDTKRIHFILNGNINYNISLGSDNIPTSFAHSGGDMVFHNKSFPYETEAGNYSEHIVAKVVKILSIFDRYDIDLPDPKHIGFISFAGEEDYFLVHYKSGSNYLNFATDEYNNKKTNELKKLL